MAPITQPIDALPEDGDTQVDMTPAETLPSASWLVAATLFAATLLLGGMFLSA